MLRPKVAGTWVLHELTRACRSTSSSAFSSVASVLGAKEADYAAANQFLDAFAHHRRALGLPALSVNWGPWDGAGMAADRAAARAFAAAGRRSRCGSTTGSTPWPALVASGAPQAVVADVDWDALKALYGGRRPAPPARRHRHVGPRPSRPRTARRPPRRLARRRRPRSRGRSSLGYLRDRVAGGPQARPGAGRPGRPLDTLGLDSLMAIELKNGVEADLGDVLPLASLLQGPTLDDLAGRLLDQLAGAGPSRLRRAAAAGSTASRRIAPVVGPAVALVAPPARPVEPGLQHRRAPSGSSARSTPRRSAGAPSGWSTATRRCGRPSRRPTARPVQRVARRGRRRLPRRGRSPGRATTDLHGASPTRRDRPFDLENGPAFRIHLFRRSATEHVLLLALHHIVGDFWSIAVLLDELGPDLPRRARRRRARPARRCRSTYADFVRWQAEMLAGPEGERLWAYWRGAARRPACPCSTCRPTGPGPPCRRSRGADAGSSASTPA